MKKLTKGLIIAATMMIVVGITLCIGGALAGGLSAAQDGIRDMIEDEGAFTMYYGTRDASFQPDEVSNLVIDIGSAEVQIHENTDLHEITVHTDGGKVDINLKNDTLYIKSNSKLDENKVYLEFPENIRFEKVDISAGASGISIRELSADYFHAEIGAGAIEIQGIDTEEVDFEIGAGEIIVNEGKVKECAIDVGMGNFVYEGGIDGDCDVNCGMGNVELYLEGDEEDFNYEIDCAAGNVTIGNESFGGLGSDRTMNNHADADMDIDCSMGNVTIEF